MPRGYHYSVEWSEPDHEFVGVCSEFPSLSWLAKTRQEALLGIVDLVEDTVADMRKNGEPLPHEIR